MKSKIYFLLIVFCYSVLNTFSQYEFLQMPTVDGEIQTAPTFNSCSYYYCKSDDAAFRVEYKRTNETNWRVAHTPVCDQPEKIYKGSLFNLDEDTEYQIRILSGNDGNTVLQTVFRTWNSAPRIVRTIDISTLPNTGQNGIVITGQGSPDAWIKYTAPAGWIVNRSSRDADTQDAVIVLKGAKYVILENLTVEGGKLHAILVDCCDFVRILNCDISGWGRTGEQQFINGNQLGTYIDAEGKVINYDGGIQIRRSYATVVERCYIHDPRGRANAWTFSHPTGPEAIVVEYTRGGNVIRWNDFVGSDEHRWNDVIEGMSNHTTDGGFYRDSDIIGNYLAFGNDDGTELEGGGMNIRFIGNKVEGTLCGISFGPNMIGPQYAIGNLIVNPGDEDGLAITFLKNMHGYEQKGKRFVYNNTLYGFEHTSIPYSDYGRGTPINVGLGAMRNNIFVCNQFQLDDWVRTENFDNDLFWVDRSLYSTEQFVADFRKYGQEQNALSADPQLADPSIGNYRLANSSPARGKSAEVAGITHAGDDLGAFFNNISDIPLRPLAFSAAPAQVNFPATGGAATVTLSLPADAVEPIPFQIRQNTVFDWFTVTPANGVIVPGETLTITVTTDPARLTGRPVFRGAFLVRTPNGLSRVVTVYAKGAYTDEKRPASAGPNTVYIDAKNGAADTQVDIPVYGVYSLLVRASISATRKDRQGFDISINGETATATVQPLYQWNVGTGAGRVVWLRSLGQLKAGTNRINIKSTGQDLTVVEYIITDNPAVFFVQERNAKR